METLFIWAFPVAVAVFLMFQPGYLFLGGRQRTRKSGFFPIAVNGILNDNINVTPEIPGFLDLLTWVALAFSISILFYPSFWQNPLFQLTQIVNHTNLRF